MTMKFEEIHDVASDYIVRTFDGENDSPTTGVGFLLEDHSDLGNLTDNPDTIEAIGLQLIRFAAEIRYNQSFTAAPKSQLGEVVEGIDWGRSGPSSDL